MIQEYDLTFAINTKKFLTIISDGVKKSRYATMNIEKKKYSNNNVIYCLLQALLSNFAYISLNTHTNINR